MMDRGETRRGLKSGPRRSPKTYRLCSKHAAEEARRRHKTLGTGRSWRSWAWVWGSFGGVLVGFGHLPPYKLRRPHCPTRMVLLWFIILSFGLSRADSAANLWIHEYYYRSGATSVLLAEITAGLRLRSARG